MKNLLLFFSFSFMAGCFPEAVDDQRQTFNDPVWEDDFQRIQISRGKGEFGTESESWDLMSSEVSTPIKNSLLGLVQVTDRLSCASSEEYTYEIVATLSTGVERRFVSSNKNCGWLTQFRFIETNSIESLITVVESEIKQQLLQEIIDNELLWNNQSITNYSFDFDNECFNCAEFGGLDFPVSLDYENDIIQAVTPENNFSSITVSDSGTLFFNIPELFDEIEDLVTNNPNPVLINWDETLGIPLTVTFNTVEGSTSLLDERTYTISNFLTN